MFGFTVLSIVGAASVALYLYTGYAAYKGAAKAGNGFLGSLGKAAVWPATIWNLMDDLYTIRPR